MSIAELESIWAKAAEGMTFFGEPVKDFNADRLLLVVGYLAEENRRMTSRMRVRSEFLDKLLEIKK